MKITQSKQCSLPGPKAVSVDEVAKKVFDSNSTIKMSEAREAAKRLDLNKDSFISDAELNAGVADKPDLRGGREGKLDTIAAGVAREAINDATTAALKDKCEQLITPGFDPQS